MPIKQESRIYEKDMRKWAVIPIALISTYCLSVVCTATFFLSM